MTAEEAIQDGLAKASNADGNVYGLPSSDGEPCIAVGYILAALSAAGFVAVPREATEAMCIAGYNAPANQTALGGRYGNTREIAIMQCDPIWRAMIAAALRG